MPLTFKTKFYADITMLNEVGNEMLEMMGFGTRVPGAIIAKDLPQALDNLQQKLLEKANQQDQDENDLPEKQETDDEDEEQPPIPLRNRALPLLELIKSAIVSDNDVSWR